MDPLIHVLYTLENIAKSNKSNRPYSWMAISQMVKNETGQTLDYDTFKQEYDNDPDFRDQFDHIATFNDKGVKFKSGEQSTEPGTDMEEPESSIDKLAKSSKGAAEKILKRPG